MSSQVKNILCLLICLSIITSINSKILRKFHKAPHMPVDIDQEYFKECLTFPGATERIFKDNTVILMM